MSPPAGSGGGDCDGVGGGAAVLSTFYVLIYESLSGCACRPNVWSLICSFWSFKSEFRILLLLFLLLHFSPTCSWLLLKRVWAGGGGSRGRGGGSPRGRGGGSPLLMVTVTFEGLLWRCLGLAVRGTVLEEGKVTWLESRVVWTGPTYTCAC